jgi:hypothetical protein
MVDKPMDEDSQPFVWCLLVGIHTDKSEPGFLQGGFSEETGEVAPSKSPPEGMVESPTELVSRHPPVSCPPEVVIASTNYLGRGRKDESPCYAESAEPLQQGGSRFRELSAQSPCVAAFYCVDK